MSDYDNDNATRYRLRFEVHVTTRGGINVRYRLSVNAMNPCDGDSEREHDLYICAHIAYNLLRAKGLTVRDDIARPIRLLTMRPMTHEEHMVELGEQVIAAGERHPNYAEVSHA